MVVCYWILVLANGTAFATLAAGWWSIPVVSLVGAILAPRRSMPLLSIPIGAALGWGALLLRSARADGFETLTATMVQVLPVPLRGVVAVTIAFPLVLALGAALLGSAFRRNPTLR
jgi:hypothetical protein